MLAILMFASIAGRAQLAEQDHFSHSIVIPRNYTDSSSSLAGYIHKNFRSPRQQIAAAYRWITYNIEYDKDSMLYINWSKETDEKIAATLRRKKGVCDNFASVFADVLNRMQIPAYVVNGLTLQNGRAARTAHSWVALQLENKWLLCDPTWDAGYHAAPRYYLSSPSEFIYTHWPFDPMWQISPRPLSLNDFENGRVVISGAAGFPSPEDSISHFLKLDNLQQLEATTRRMQAAGQQKEVVKNWTGYNNMNIAIIYGEQDMNLYNDAVANLNKANSHLNKFIEYRNNLFEPAMPDAQILRMLDPIKPAIADAYKTIESIGRVKENYQYDTGDLKERLKRAEARLQQQKDFLQRYLSTTPAQRRNVFY